MIDARRVLILAPHPDDEIVACGIAALRTRAAGGQVFVLFLTTGVPQGAGYERRVGRRREEADRALRLLQAEPLGFRATPSRRLRHELDAAARDVAAAIARCEAEALWVTAFEGGHQDHDAANAAASSFAGQLPVREFAAYNFAGRRVRQNEFPDRCGGEWVITASGEEMARKRELLGCYPSERGNLRHVGVAQETGRPLARHEYARPPHPGRLFRERFHWVPFRHSRIDWDASADVYSDLASWVSARPRQRAPALG